MRVTVAISEIDTNPSSLRPRPKWYVNVTNDETCETVMTFDMRERSNGGVKLRSDPFAHRPFSGDEQPAISVATSLVLAAKAWDHIERYATNHSLGLSFSAELRDE